MKSFLQRLFIKPSTQAYTNEARKLPGYSKAGWLHGYVYGRWPYLYIAVGTGRHPLTWLFKGLYALFMKVQGRRPGNRDEAKIAFAHGYHGKVMPLEQARKLVSVDRDLDLGDLEQVIPYAAARNLVLQSPDHIVALECPCRASRKEPCLPLGVCLIVGEPFAGFIAEHHPKRARWVSGQEALGILEAEQKRGHVHHAFFKDVMHGRFYAICNCCACCCGAMKAHRNGVPMLAPSGYICRVNHERCKHCSQCVKHCQFKALHLDGELLVLDPSKCMGCGVCAAQCPNQSLELVRDPGKGVHLDLHQLVAQRPRLAQVKD